jgi:hypothetical protein
VAALAAVAARAFSVSFSRAPSDTQRNGGGGVGGVGDDGGGGMAAAAAASLALPEDAFTRAQCRGKLCDYSCDVHFGSLLCCSLGCAIALVTFI